MEYCFFSNVKRSNSLSVKCDNFALRVKTCIVSQYSSWYIGLIVFFLFFSFFCVYARLSYAKISLNHATLTQRSLLRFLIYYP